MESKELLKYILNLATSKKYPDIHLNSKHKPRYRDINWDITVLEKIWEKESYELSEETIKEIIKEITNEDWLKRLEQEMELDTSIEIKKGDRYRVNCYKDTKWYSIAFRMIPSRIPSLEEIWLGEQIKEMCSKDKWLILVTWPTGSWKSTNLVAMLNYINKNFKKHIITIEDPVEFSFNSEKSLVNQRELWIHTKNFAEAIRASLREDPDVIMVWEMRDIETIKAVMTLAETWHLVLSTLHISFICSPSHISSRDGILDGIILNAMEYHLVSL